MSPSLSTKVLLFSGISLLQISTNFVDLAQVSALTLTCGTGMSKCQEAHVLESCNAKVNRYMNTANLSVRDRAYLLRNEPIDLSLNFVDGARLSVPEGRQDAAFEIAENGAQGTSAGSTLVRAQRLKTVGDLKTWLASVRGKSKFLIDVFLLENEMQLEDTQTLSQIGEASNNTGPVILFVLERDSFPFSKDASVQDFLEQYGTRLKNFTEIESFTADQVVQKNEVTVRIERADIDSTSTKTSSDKDSPTFFEFTFVRERTSELTPGGSVDAWGDKI